MSVCMLSVLTRLVHKQTECLELLCLLCYWLRHWLSLNIHIWWRLHAMRLHFVIVLLRTPHFIVVVCISATIAIVCWVLIVHVVYEVNAWLIVSMEETIVILMKWISLFHFLKLLYCKYFSVLRPPILQIPVIQWCLIHWLLYNIIIQWILWLDFWKYTLFLHWVVSIWKLLSFCFHWYNFFCLKLRFRRKLVVVILPSQMESDGGGSWDRWLLWVE
jgi:hypothetical protein